MAAKDTLIWLGAVADDQRVLQSAAASPAANRWQRGLVSALADAGITVHLVGHWPEPVFPKGPLFVSGGKEPMPGMPGAVDQTWVSYINAPLVRAGNLINRNTRAVRALIKGCKDRLLGVVSYNAFDVGSKIKADILGGARIPWVPIVADAEGSVEGRERLARETSMADAAIVLSWRIAEEWHDCPVLHLDGGVEPERLQGPGSAQAGDRAVFPFLYCGATNRWAGVDLLAEAFAEWPDPRARLWVCGKGAVPERFPTLKSDSRVVCFGAVSDEKVDELAAQCYALVNPRRTDLLDNQMNFPSKILEYLRYGKPVISTWTDGLDPAYRSVLTVAQEGTPQAFRAALASTMLWSAEDQRRQADATRQFLLGSRTWGQQARRLRAFMESISA
jgi:glycosyltransferase involved in cell wall biosynthesis